MFGMMVIMFITPIWGLLLLGKCLLVIFGVKKWLSLDKHDYTSNSDNILLILLASWGIDVVASTFSIFFMLFISNSIPFLSIVHSEWGISYHGVHINAAIYILITLVIYVSTLSTVNLVYKKKIATVIKQKKLFRLFIASSVVMLAIVGVLTIT